MSFSSVKSQQYGRVQNYAIAGSANSTVSQTIFSNEGTGKYIYSLVLDLGSTNTFTSVTITIGKNLTSAGAMVTNVLKYDVTGKSDYNLSLSGVEVDDFDIRVYASTTNINTAVTWVGTVQLIRVVE
jgi:hypothetical protein